MWDAVLLVVSLALSAASGATLFFAPLVRTSRLIDILFIVSTSIAVIAAVRILARLATAWANRVAMQSVLAQFGRLPGLVVLRSGLLVSRVPGLVLVRSPGRFMSRWAGLRMSF
jgi:hypothetical protein